MLTFWWVRHAPVIGNNDCCYGNNDVDCDLSDFQTFKELSNNLPSDGIVFTSGLTRAIETFKKTKSFNKLTVKNIIDKRLEEQNLGDWTGLSYKDLILLTKEKNCYSDSWLMKPDYEPPNGESFNNIINRVNSFLIDIIKNYSNENIIIFSHGGPIRAALSIALSTKKEDVIHVDIENTKLTRIDFSNNFWMVRFINL